MAKSVPSRVGAGAGSWSIVTPAPNQVVPLNPDNTVTVVVDDEGSGNTGYLAAIYSGSAPSAPSGSGPWPGYTPLASNDGGSTYTWNVPINFPGVFQSQQNVIVYPLTSLTSPQTNPFSLSVSGVGSGLAGGVATSCCPSALVPIWLYAHVSSSGATDGVYQLIYQTAGVGSNIWAAVTLDAFRLLCGGSGLSGWSLAVRGPFIYSPPNPASCGPPIALTFTGVNLSSYGGGTNATVTILTVP